jgi:hypothetical protein
MEVSHGGGGRGREEVDGEGDEGKAGRVETTALYFVAEHVFQII